MRRLFFWSPEVLGMRCRLLMLGLQGLTRAERGVEVGVWNLAVGGVGFRGC